MTSNSTFKFVHAEHEDTDIVRCTFNNWNHIIDQERRRLQTERMKKYTHNGMVCIDRTFKNVTNKEAEDSLNMNQDEIKKHNHTCNQVFVSKTVKHTTMKAQTSRWGIGTDAGAKHYQCNVCYAGLSENHNVWLCPDHSQLVICSLCHGFRAEQQIYATITRRLNNDAAAGHYIDPDDTKQLEQREKMQQNKKKDLEKTLKQHAAEAGEKASNNFFRALKAYSGKNDIAKEIVDIIADYLGKCTSRFAGNMELKKLFDIYWKYEMAAFAPNKWGWLESPCLRKLDMNMKEYEEIKQDGMYKKYVVHNCMEVDLEAFKKKKTVEMLYEKKANGVLQNHVLGDILDVLCGDNFNKFYGIMMKLKDYSYAAHPYYPGGPPQVCGIGDCILFKIGDEDEYGFYCLWSYQQQSVGM